MAPGRTTRSRNALYLSSISWPGAASASTGAARPITALNRLCVLSGAGASAGIDPATVKLRAIDCSSGVELAPGIKDPVKLRALFAALRPSGRSGS